MKTSVKIKGRGATAVMTLLFLAIVQAVFIPRAQCASLEFRVPADFFPEGPRAILPSHPAAGDSVFYADRSTGTFAVFESDGGLERPVKFGTFQEELGTRRVLSRQEIHAEDGYYIFTNPEDPTFLSVSERLPEGGFGRLLRYRGQNPEGQSVDLEFVYEDRERRVTLLDYRSGKFYRTDFTERHEAAHLFPTATEVRETFELNSTATPGFRFLIPGQEAFLLTRPQTAAVVSLALPFDEQEAWFARLLRGPPVGGQIS